MFSLNSKYVVSEYDSLRVIKATEDNLISLIETELRSISDNLEYLDESKTSKQDATNFVHFIKDEIGKLKDPYEYAKENLTSLEFYLKDLLKRTEDFLIYNMQLKDNSIHGLS